MWKLYVILLFSTFAFSSCEGFFESPLPDYAIPFESRLVIFSIISPNSENTIVEVKRNRPTNGVDNKGNDLVVDATVQIFDGIDTFKLSYDKSNRHYKISADTLKIRPNVQYKLLVKTLDGLSAYAECKVPDTLLNSMKVRFNRNSVVRKGANDTTNIGQFVFNNLEGETDYYDVIYEEYFVIRNDFDLISTYSWGLTHGRGNLGNSIATKFYTYAPLSKFSTRNNMQSYLRFLLTDINYYRYHQSVLEFKQAKSNPFAENAPIFTNIEGGLGVFAAFVQRRFQL